MSFVGDIYKGMVTKFQEPIATNAELIGNAIKPLVMSCFLLYILFLVYKIYTKKDVIFEEIGNAMLLFAVIGVFTFSGRYYYDYVIPFVLDAGDDISSALITDPNASSDSVTAVDTVYNLFELPLAVIRARLDDIGFTQTYIGVWAENAPARLALWLSQSIFTLFIAINLLIAKVMVTLLLSVGVIFFCFAAFPSTRGLFTAFTGAALNYILLNVMYSIAANIAASVIKSNDVVGESSADEMIGGAGTILLSTIIIMFAVNQIPSLVSTLTGGIGISPFTISSSGFAKAARFMGINKAARMVGSKTGQTVRKGASGAWNKLRGKASAKNN